MRLPRRHPGNLAADSGFAGGRLIVYDFGQVASLDAVESAGMLAAIEAIVDSDADACVAAFDAMGLLKGGANRKALRDVIAGNFASGRVQTKAQRPTTRSNATNEPPSDLTPRQERKRDAAVLGHLLYIFDTRQNTQRLLASRARQLLYST